VEGWIGPRLEAVAELEALFEERQRGGGAEERKP
jgi:hypothetical protein